MLVNERQELIVNLLAKHQTMTMQQLVEATESSESTIRRDLTELESNNKLSRIHGGATIKSTSMAEKTLYENAIENVQAKEKIAAHAVKLIKDGDCIFIDAGTTMLQLIPLLKGKNITVVTNGMTHIQQLHELGITTYMIGGLLKSNTQAFIGGMAVQALLQYHFDYAFIGINGFTMEHGYTTADPEEALVKRQAILQAKKAYALADHSKYAIVKFAKISDVEEMTLITEGLKMPLVKQLKQRGMEVIVV